MSEEGLPEVLYKFLPRNHAESMVSNGEVRVGTLFEYRALEGVDAERGDSGEGTLTQHSNSGLTVYNSTEELPAVLQRMGVHCGPGGLATQGEGGMVFQFTGENLLIYCTSLEFDLADLEKWGGACIKITQPRTFFHAINDALRHNHFGWIMSDLGCGKCEYVGRRHNWHSQVSPEWLLKPLNYQDQKEFRFAWRVCGITDIQHLIVRSPAIARVCILQS